MATLSISQIWTRLCGLDRASLMLLAGAVVFTVAVIVLIRTRWGHSRSLEKCVLFSILAHLLLTGYAATVRFVTYCPAPKEQYVRIALVDGPVGADHGQIAGTDPAASLPPPKPPKPDAIPTAIDRKKVKPKASVAADAKQPSQSAAGAKPQAPSLAIPAAAQTAIRQLASQVSAVSRWNLSESAQKYLKEISVARSQSASTNPPAAPIPVVAMTSVTTESPSRSTPAAETSAPANPSTTTTGAGPNNVYPVPEAYKLRLSTDHLGLARAGGGSKETEAAVQAALKWLAEHQSDDGRWDARRNEAGRETSPDGRSRPNAGIDADTGMTGLALLAMLGAGNTHERGAYRENIRRGLNFLMQSQDAYGCLSGTADRYAAMYCHAIATFALGEAYGMTGERRLEQPLRRAIGYTIAAQDPYGGGWRYRPRDAGGGDTSQLGWQFMALKSADLAGIHTPESTRQGIIRYLQSVASRPNGGLAAYRPLEAPSRTMTAEAMLCWQFLGLPREHPACDEAAAFLLSAPPDVGQSNFYYWYYGTLVMYQLQGEGWQRWNVAVATQLVGLQNKAGPLAGSWDPDSAWGGYGGRVYSTALGAMCLEVYYRFLPVYRK
jgi:hypothetical protein